MHEDPAATSDGPLDPFAMKTIRFGQNLLPGDPRQRGQEGSGPDCRGAGGRTGRSLPLTPETLLQAAARALAFPSAANRVKGRQCTQVGDGS